MNTELNNKISLRLEPVVISGKSFGIKLLSVYEFLKCEISCKNLIDSLVNKGFNSKICSEVAERACIIACSTYNKDNTRVFCDGLDVLVKLTPQELDDIYQEYTKLTRKVIKFNKYASNKINFIKSKCREFS